MGGALSHPITNKTIHRNGSPYYKVGTVGMQGYRQEMEDEHSAITSYECDGNQSDIGFFAVYDGHAGASTAKHCAQELHKKVLRAVPPMLPFNLLDSKAIATLTKAVMDADAELHLQEQQETRRSGAYGGCTAIFAVIIPIADGQNKPLSLPLPPSRAPRKMTRSTSISQAPGRKPQPGPGHTKRWGSEGGNAIAESFGRGSSGATAPEFKAGGDGLPESSDVEVEKIMISTAIVGNLGDSRCLLGRADGSWQAMSEDHKPKNPIERTRIYRAGGFVQADRVDGCLALSRAMGDFNYKSVERLPPSEQRVIACPDFAVQTVCTGDYLVLCCDGIFDVMSNKQVMTFVHRRVMAAEKSGVPLDPDEVMSDLIMDCLARGSQDNMTAMLVMFADGVSYHQDKEEFRPSAMPAGASAEFQESWAANCRQSGVAPELVLATMKAEQEAKAAAKKANRRRRGSSVIMRRLSRSLSGLTPRRKSQSLSPTSGSESTSPRLSTFTDSVDVPAGAPEDPSV